MLNFELIISASFNGNKIKEANLELVMPAI